MALFVHLFDALAQLAFSKLAHAGAKHLLVFRQCRKWTRDCLVDGNLSLTHCLTGPAERNEILDRHHNQRVDQKAKPEECLFFSSLSLWERAGERACASQASHPPL